MSDAALEAQVTPHHDPWCFGCGRENPAGLRLDWDAVEDERFDAPLRLDRRHQGGPGLAHGGVVSAALDEAMGILVARLAFPAVTARLQVAFRRPAPIEAELRLAAWLERRQGRQLHLASALRQGDDLLAEATGTFLQVSLRHFLGTDAGRATAEAWRRRLGTDG